MSFILDEADGQDIPRIVEKALAAGAAGVRGALMLIDGSGNAAECGADPAAIAAVAEHGFGARATSGLTFHTLNTKEFPPGKVLLCPVQDQVFSAEYTGTLPAADGGSYGVVRGADSQWRVDFTETVNTRLKLVGRYTDSPFNGNRVKVRFLDANVQTF